MDDPEKLNDRSSYQRCIACGQKNDSGLQMVFRREGDRIRADFLPQEHHQGFPGVLHGGIIASLLDETLGRTGALRGQWLMTGKLDIRYRRPAPIGDALMVWGRIVRERPGAIEAGGAVELSDGTVVADARGFFLRLPEPVVRETLARYPEFANYWAE
jgi:acyl-coenzyme A thioesterase PaaI-like protein